MSEKNGEKLLLVKSAVKRYFKSVAQPMSKWTLYSDPIVDKVKLCPATSFRFQIAFVLLHPWLPSAA